MGVPERCLHLRMTEQAADDRRLVPEAIVRLTAACCKSCTLTPLSPAFSQIRAHGLRRLWMCFPADRPDK